MSRRKNMTPRRLIQFSIPETLCAELDVLTFDPVRGKPEHGRRSKIMTQALKEYLDRERNTRTRTPRPGLAD